MARNRSTTSTPKTGGILDDPEILKTKLEPGPKYDARPTSDQERGERERQEAFDSGFSWKGQRLEPFSVTRYNVFLSQRTGCNAPDLGRALIDSDAIFSDALRILWLCSHSLEEIERERYQPQRMQQVIEAWAEENVRVSDHTDLSLIGLKIYNTAMRNQHETAPLAGNPHADDLGN